MPIAHAEHTTLAHSSAQISQVIAAYEQQAKSMLDERAALQKKYDIKLMSEREYQAMMQQKNAQAQKEGAAQDRQSTGILA